MSNKEYRLQRLKQGTKFKQAEAKVKTSEAKIAESKEKLASYKSKKVESKAISRLAQQIREQEARKRNGGTVFKKVSGAVKFKPQLSKTLLSYANAFSGGSSGSSSQGRTQSGPGRPKLVYKHRSPFTGKPIDAPTFYKEVRAFKRLQDQQASTVQRQQAVQLARKGVPASQAQQLVQQRIQQMALQEQLQQLQQRQNPQVEQNIQPSQYPNQMNNQTDPRQMPDGTVIPMGNKIWKFQRGVVDTDWTAFGTKKVLRGTESSFWN